MPVAPKDARLIDERDGGKCVICGWQATNKHHRKPRKHKDDSPANMLSLCGSGTTGCHGWVTSHPKDAYAHGWSIRTNDDPTEIPILVRSRNGDPNVWVLHNNDGTQIRITQRDAIERLTNAGLRTETP